MFLKKSKKRIIVFIACVVAVVAIFFAAEITMFLVTKNVEYTPPATESVYDSSDAKTVMALIADPQVSFYSPERYSVFKAAVEDLRSMESTVDAIIGAGDITENATIYDYKLITEGLTGIDARYIMATGNHDIRLHRYSHSVETFSEFANSLNNNKNPLDALHFSECVGGYKVIVLGSDRTELEKAYLGDKELEWLDNEIAEENGKPTFVICHQPLKDTHNEMNAFGSITHAGGNVGDQSIAVKKILSKYKNVFFITGHLHSGFGPDSYNYVDGIHCINVPSFAIENKDGTYNDAGTGYIMEVDENEVRFRARDFAKGTWVTETTGDDSYDIVIDIEI